MNDFAQMVWKGTVKVGFGINESKRMVIAWYCDKRGSTGGTEAFKLNIEKDCSLSGYNKCFNTDAHKRLLVLRKDHEATNTIKLDTTRAEALQKVMDRTSY